MRKVLPKRKYFRHVQKCSVQMKKMKEQIEKDFHKALKQENATRDMQCVNEKKELLSNNCSVGFN